MWVSPHNALREWKKMSTRYALTRLQMSVKFAIVFSLYCVVFQRGGCSVHLCTYIVHDGQTTCPHQPSLFDANANGH